MWKQVRCTCSWLNQLFHYLDLIQPGSECGATWVFQCWASCVPEGFICSRGKLARYLCWVLCLALSYQTCAGMGAAQGVSASWHAWMSCIKLGVTACKSVPKYLSVNWTSWAKKEFLSKSPCSVLYSCTWKRLLLWRAYHHHTSCPSSNPSRCAARGAI